LSGYIRPEQAGHATGGAGNADRRMIRGARIAAAQSVAIS
jgi:hypothetical protein